VARAGDRVLAGALGRSVARSGDRVLGGALASGRCLQRSRRDRDVFRPLAGWAARAGEER
jgi:hypothetical protein